MTSYEERTPEQPTAVGGRCLVLVDAIQDIEAIRAKLAEIGLNHTAYLLDIAKLDLVASLYRVPDQKLSPLAKSFFVETAPQSENILPKNIDCPSQE